MKLRQFILFGASGSAGNFTVSNWNGITVGKNKVTHMTNPNTPAQQVTRKKRKAIGKIFAGLGLLIQTSVQKNVTGQSKFSQLLKLSNPAVTVDNTGAIVLSPILLAYAKGELETTAPGYTVAMAGTDVKITLQASNPANTSDTDNITILELSQEEAKTRYYANAGTRNVTAPQVITYEPMTTEPGIVYLYIFYTSEDGKMSSNSTYLGSVTII